MSRRHIGRYELRERLGRGGEGEVWDAMLHGPAGFRRRVALKLLRETRAEDDQDALIHEARLGALIHHPNVVPTLELGVDEGRWYLVMERVDGRTTKQLVMERPLPPSVLLDIGRQAAAGLQHIHDLTDDDGSPLGLVHRDVKPTNLMVDRYGAVRILDLGIAKLAGDGSGAAGTPGYMAPEQRHGQESPRADVFGLAATLAALALGGPVFGRGAVALTALDDVDGFLEVRGIGARLDDVLRGLGGVLLRGLRDDPRERYPSMQAMSAALQSLYPSVDRVVSLAGHLGRPDPATPLPAEPVVDDSIRLFGRDRERQVLEEQLAAHDVRCIAVRGPAGCGKSHLVHATLSERSPRWCSLRDVRTPAGVVRALSEAAGRHLGDDLDHVAENLATDDGVWVLDDVDDAYAPVRDLLRHWKAYGPTVVVTTRRRIRDVPGVELRLGPLSVASALSLLTSHGGPGGPDDHETMQELVRIVGRLPLAVQLVGVRARQQGYGPTLQALSDRPDGLDPLVHGLEVSAESLGAGGAKALVDLSVFAGPFDADAAMAVVGTDVPDRLAALAELVDHSLVDTRKGRFRMLPPVRSWAARRDERRRASAEVRHGRWVGGIGRRMLDASVGVRPIEARVVLPELTTAMERAQQRGDRETQALTALAVSMATWTSGRRTVALEVLHQALPLPNGSLRQHVISTLCERLMIAGQLEEALQRAEDWLDDCDEEDRLHAERIRGRILVKMGRWDEGMDAIQRALVGFEERGDAAVAVTLSTLGEAEIRRQDYDAATHWLQRGLDASRRLRPLFVERVRYNLVVVLALQERYREAIEPLGESVDEFERFGRMNFAIAARVNLAELYQLQGRHQDALAVLEQGLAGGMEHVPAALMLHIHVLRADHELVHDRWDLSAADAVDLDHPCEEANTRCHAALLLALAAQASDDPARAVAARERAEVDRAAAYPITRSRVLLYDARHLPVGQARKRVEAEEPPSQPFSRAFHTLARATVAIRAGDRSVARGALLEADLTIRQLGVTPRAYVSAELQRLRDELVRPRT